MMILVVLMMLKTMKMCIRDRFLTNQGDPDKERRVLDWKLSSLRLLVAETSDHQTGAA